MPKRTSDEYIQLNKKIVHKEVRNAVLRLAKEWSMTDKEVCYQLIRVGALKEVKKLENV